MPEPDAERSGTCDEPTPDGTPSFWRWHLESPAEAASLARVLRGGSGEIEWVATGTSMGATVPAASLIRIDSRPEVEVGDVVAVLAGPNTIIVHRVVGFGWRWRRDYLVTRGDAHALCDQPTSRDAVLGRVLDVQIAGQWQPVRSAPPTSPGGALVRVTHLRLMLAALLVSPSVAAGFAALSYHLHRLTTVGRDG